MKKSKGSASDTSLEAVMALLQVSSSPLGSSEANNSVDDDNTPPICSSMDPVNELFEIPDGNNAKPRWKPNKEQMYRKMMIEHLAKKGHQPLTPDQQRARYCGSHPALVAAARESKTGDFSKRRVRAWLKENPQVLEDMGLAVAPPPGSHLQKFDSTWHIDHIIAGEIGGADHPFNYFVMENRVNSSFLEFYTQVKLAYIGLLAIGTAAKFAKWEKAQKKKLAAKGLIDYDKFEGL